MIYVLTILLRVLRFHILLLTTHAGRILPITGGVALEWGRLSAEPPRPMEDGLIAATAAVHGMTIVTRNADDFADVPAPVINPWRL